MNGGVRTNPGNSGAWTAAALIQNMSTPAREHVEIQPVPTRGTTPVIFALPALAGEGALDRVIPAGAGEEAVAAAALSILDGDADPDWGAARESRRGDCKARLLARLERERAGLRLPGCAVVRTGTLVRHDLSDPQESLRTTTRLADSFAWYYRAAIGCEGSRLIGLLCTDLPFTILVLTHLSGHLFVAGRGTDLSREALARAVYTNDPRLSAAQRREGVWGFCLRGEGNR